MRYICDFFVRHKEAVSNQMELLAHEEKDFIFAATRFMGQKALQRAELKDEIYVLPALLYNLILPFIVLKDRQPIHYFEEEPSAWKRLLFNARKRELYISMYRRPTKAYADHLKKYKFLEKVFVELNDHRNILISEGVLAKSVIVSPTPAKIPYELSGKVYDPEAVTLVFASWNNKEKNALHDRGLLYLLDLLATNPHLRLEIPLRDKKTDEFMSELRKRDIVERVSLLNIKNTQELIDMYDRSDLVAFTAQARVTKDVPNSLLDGLMRGKPVLLSTAIDFHTIVAAERLGLVVPVGEAAATFTISNDQYDIYSRNAFEYASRHTPERYLQLKNHYKRATV